MRNFPVSIYTPNGAKFDGEAQSLIVRSVCGDVCILAGHIDYVTTIEVGKVKIKTETEERVASCSGGFLTVKNGEAKLVATTFEFSDEIDVARAEAAKEKAQKRIDAAQSDKDLRLAELKLKRALNRINVSKM